jgi:hypothetical protein
LIVAFVDVENCDSELDIGSCCLLLKLFGEAIDLFIRKRFCAVVKDVEFRSGDLDWFGSVQVVLLSDFLEVRESKRTVPGDSFLLSKNKKAQPRRVAP